LLKSFKHANIVQYFGSQIDKNNVYVFLEYVLNVGSDKQMFFEFWAKWLGFRFVPGGSIQSLLSKFGSLDETLIRVYTKQILQGLQYLHDHSIAHRDIKGANILVDTKGRVKLADFGCSKAFSGTTPPSHLIALDSPGKLTHWIFVIYKRNFGGVVSHNAGNSVLDGS